MTFYAGIDLGKRKSQIHVIDEKRRVLESVKIDNRAEEFVRVLRKYKGDVIAGCEATSNAFWVADVVEPWVSKILVGDTKKLRWIAELRVKTDKIDAGILAELVRADLFPSVRIPPARIRALREMVRGLTRLRREATRYRNRIHGLLGRHGVLYEREEVQGDSLGELVRTSKLPDPVTAAAQTWLRLEAVTREEQRTLDRGLRKELKGEAELRRIVGLLETIPGVGYYSSVLFALELWQIERFPDADHLAGYIGFVPSTYQTGQTLRNGPITKQGNPLLRWVLIQDAWVSTRNHWFFGKLYSRHKARLGKTKAIVPVARALLNTVYRVWSQGRTYEEIFENKTLAG